MSTTPKITIIVPVYNVATYLKKCLESLSAQTYKDISIVCVNDGSTDDSPKILEEYAKTEPRMKIINKKNGGLSSSRNVALKSVKTEYVMFCDSDDRFSPRMCERMIESIESDNSDIAICALNVVYEAHEEMRESDNNYYRLNYSGKETIDDDVILNTDVSVVSKIFRTKIIKDNDLTFPEGINNEDFYFYNAYMSLSSRATFINQGLYDYIRREDSIMSNNFEAKTLSMDHLIIAEKLYKFYCKTGYIKSHANLFWKQWVLSFWFSIEHSSKDTHKQIYARAKAFAAKNLATNPPTDPAVKKEVRYIQTNNIFKKIGRKARKTLAKTYKAVNIRYRQQSYVNSELESLLKSGDELASRINKLKEE